VRAVGKGYRTRLEWSFVFSLLMLILIFVIHPRTADKIPPLHIYKAPGLQLIEIPRTRQAVKRRPKPAKPVIPVPSDEPEISEEVLIEYPETTSTFQGEVPAGPLDAEDLPYLPRQILEYLPGACGENIRGEVQLLLLINKKGRVKEHRVLKNTVHSRQCLNNVVKAAYKSRWEVVTLPTGKVEYWIKKIYRIGISNNK